MISLIVIIILALTGTVVAGFYFFTLMYNQNLQLQAQKNDLFMDQIKNQVIQKAKPAGENGEFLLPYGENIANGVHTLPSWVSTMRKNPWGKYIIYCPMGATNEGTLSQSVSLNAEGSYAVELLKDFRTKDNGIERNYVSASKYQDVNGDSVLDRAPDFDNDGLADDIIAILISPYPNNNDVVPTCKDITYFPNEETFSAVGGSVRVIYSSEAEFYANIKDVSNRTATNSLGYSFNINNVESNTLNNNLSYYSMFSSKTKAYFYLSEGVHEFENIDFINKDKINKEIIFVGVEDDPETTEIEKTVITSKTDSSTLTFKGYEVTFKDINFSNDTRLKIENGGFYTEGKVEISTPFLENTEWHVIGQTKVVASSQDNEADILNGNVSSLFLKSSKLFINDNNQLIVEVDASDDWGLYAFDSYLTLEGDNSTNNIIIKHKNNTNDYGIVLYQSELNQRDSRIYFDSTVAQTMAIYLDSYSKYHAFNGILNLSGYERTGVYVRGFFEAINHSIRPRNSVAGIPAVMLDLRDGASLILRGSTKVGNEISYNKPYIGVADNGARFIGGEGAGTGTVVVYASHKCWQGLSETEPRIFTATETMVENIGENGVTSRVKNTEHPHYDIYRVMNSSNWNCNSQ